jgi:hypothetical protein
MGHTIDVLEQIHFFHGTLCSGRRPCPPFHHRLPTAGTEAGRYRISKTAIERRGWRTAAIVGVVLMAVDGSSGQNPQSRPAPTSGSAERETQSWTQIPIDDSHVFLAPYVWKRGGAGRSARAEAAIPGAYIKATFRGSAGVRLLIDGAANNDCPPAAMPVVDYSLNRGAFKSVQLTRTGEVYALPLADGLERGEEQHLEVHMRAAPLMPNRWTTPTVHLRLAGLEIAEGGVMLPVTTRPKRAIGFGDSITEGVCVEGLCPYYSNLMMNNARATWFPVVCAALNCEYGQLGTGGQGMVRPMEIPPLPQTWDHYDAETSRLTDGRLLPEPDYVFCAMGTNDYQGDGEHLTLPPIADEYTRWLIAVRKACPHAMIFCVVPPLGWHGEEIAGLVAARNQVGDRRVFLIDTAPLKGGFSVRGATEYAPDGVHPSVHGNAVLGASIAVQVQACLGGVKE